MNKSPTSDGLARKHKILIVGTDSSCKDLIIEISGLTQPLDNINCAQVCGTSHNVKRISGNLTKIDIGLNLGLGPDPWHRVIPYFKKHARASIKTFRSAIKGYNRIILLCDTDDYLGLACMEPLSECARMESIGISGFFLSPLFPDTNPRSNLYANAVLDLALQKLDSYTVLPRRVVSDEETLEECLKQNDAIAIEMIKMLDASVSIARAS